MAGLYLNSSQNSTNIDRRLQYAEKDASAITAILNAIFSTFGLKDSVKVTLFALFGLRGNRKQFKASYHTIATQIEKNNPGETTDASAFSIRQKMRRRIEAVKDAQAELGIELIQHYPGGEKKSEGGYSSGEYELPFVNLAMEAMKRAHADPAYSQHPGKAYNKAALEAAQAALAKAKLKEEKEGKPKQSKTKDDALEAQFAREQRKSKQHLANILQYELTAKFAGRSQEAAATDVLLLLQPFAVEYERRKAARETRNDTHIPCIITGGAGSRGPLSEFECLPNSPDISHPSPQGGIKNDTVETTYFSLEEPEKKEVAVSSFEGQVFESAQPEPVPADAAREMIEVFESVGASAFDTIYTTIDKRQYFYEGAADGEEFKSWLPSALRKCAAESLNFITRPRMPKGAAVALVQLDDLNPAALGKVREESFLTLETSPGNFQAWLALDEGELAADGAEGMRRRLIDALGADGGANGAVRIAGSLNVKPQYAPHFPIVRVLEANFGLLASAAALEAVIAENRKEEKKEPKAPPCDHSSVQPAVRRFPTGELPDYGRILRGASMTRENKPDISRADFHGAGLALKWGYSERAVVNWLKDVSPKARERKDDYAERTVRNAARRLQGVPCG